MYIKSNFITVFGGPFSRSFGGQHSYSMGSMVVCTVITLERLTLQTHCIAFGHQNVGQLLRTYRMWQTLSLVEIQ